jgi:Ca2+-binding RTX toxin-like protein
MRRPVLLVAATVLALIIASGVALAATFTCTTNPCNGTSGQDTITGTVNAETINGQAGNDGISARDGNDQINGGANNDTTNGGNGNDTYKFANSWGADRISADSAGVDTLNYSALTATFTGGNGVTSNLNGHGTTLCPSTANGCLSVAGAFIENVVGTAFADTLSGNPSKNKITGGAGNDSMLGESGNDKMDGNLGDDQYFFTNNWGAETVLDTGGVDRIAWNNPATTGPNLTVNLNSRDTSPEVTDGTNTINWSGNIIEDVQAGPGNDQVTLNSSNNTVVNVSGADAYNGYGPGGPASGVDLIADFGGSPDTLDLSNFNRAKTTFFFGNTGTGTPVIFLGIEFADGSQIWLQDYFDGTSTNGCANGPGIGLMENIVFSDATMNFSAVQAKLGCSSAAGATGNTTADSQTQPLTLKTHRLNTQDSFTGSNSGALSGIQR